VHDCPDGAVVAVLAGGDGVLATGRTEDGLWIEIRSPLDVTSPAWMSAGVLDADGDVGDLPVHECLVEATTTTTGSTTTTSTTSTSTSTTTTTEPDETTTTRPPVTQPPTTPPPAPDRAPTVGQPASNTPAIEHSTCTFDEFPKTAQLTVSASDDRAGLVVTMSFRTVSQGNEVFAGGSLTVQGPVNGVYRATLGPLPIEAMAAGAPTHAEVTVRVQDSGGHVVVRVLNAPTVGCS
jgi:hypothetical protein